MRREPPDEKTRKEIREFFGLENYRPKPLPCYTFNTMVKASSFMPDQSKNPFAEYINCPEYNDFGGDKVLESGLYWQKLHDFCSSLKIKDGEGSSTGPSGKKEAAHVSIHPSGVEVDDSSFHNDRTSSSSCKDDVLSGPDMIIDELGMSKNSKVADKIAYDKEGNNVETIGNAHKDLSSIQRILMDDSDDPDMLCLLDKDVNLDLARDFGSIFDKDMSGDKSLIMESTENEKLAARESLKGDGVGENKRENPEVNSSVSEGGVGMSQAQKSVDAGISSSPEFLNLNVTCLKDAQSRKKKLCKQNVPQEHSVVLGLTFTQRESENVGRVSFGEVVDNCGRRNLLVSSAKKKEKVKNTKKVPKKDAESGKHKLGCVESGAHSSMRSGGDEAMVRGKTLKQNALRLSISCSTEEDTESGPKTCERLRYSREQLLHLGKTALVPDYIKKVVQELRAEILEKHQISAAFEIAEAGILKKRGSSSEARKEKKKQKKRKKRAELNRKLGVKRLKLQPIVKPKIVQHCRHYLQGRCHEGEKCKFSHDVVPFTKSKPCCHFARQACMKGDDCPFDHELFKYPCNNFVDTGFCNRGESCLFSHKIPVKQGSEPSSVALKSDTGSVDQHDISKSKQEADSSIPVTSGKAASNNLNKTIATQISQPVKKPKGLSFFSFRGSQLDDSVHPKESDLSKQSLYTLEETSDSRKTSISIPGSSMQQGISYPLYERTSIYSSKDNKQPSVPAHRDNSSSYNSSGKSPLNESAKYQLKDISDSRNDYSFGIPKSTRAFSDSEMRDGIPSPTPTPTPTPSEERDIGVSCKAYPTFSQMFSTTVDPQVKHPPSNSQSNYAVGVSSPNEAINTPAIIKSFLPPTPTLSSDSALKLSEMGKGGLVSAKAKAIIVSSSDGPSYDISGDRSTSVFSTKGNTNMQTCFKEKGDINVSENSKEVQPDPGLWGSQTSPGQYSAKFDLPVKNPSSNSQKSLQSSYDISGGKSTRVFSTKRNTNMQNCFKEKGDINVSENSKEVQPDPGLWGSQTSPGQYSAKFDLPVKNPSSNSQKSLQSSYDISGGKSTRVFSTKGNTNMQNCFKEKGDINVSENSKEVQPDPGLWGSQTSPGQYSAKFDLPVKNPSSNSQKSLQSSYDISGGKSTRVFSTKGNTNMQNCFKEKGDINVSENSKEVQPDPGLWGSQTFLGQYSAKIDQPVKNPSRNSQKSLQSSYDISSGKSTGVFSTKGDNNMHTCFREKGDINVPENSKEVQPNPGLWGSQTSPVQYSAKFDLPVKTPPSNSQKALHFTLAFASKHQSGIKMSSTAPSKVNNLNELTSCSGSREGEWLQASKCLQFLSRQGDKEKR